MATAGGQDKARMILVPFVTYLKYLIGYKHLSDTSDASNTDVTTSQMINS